MDRIDSVWVFLVQSYALGCFIRKDKIVKRKKIRNCELQELVAILKDLQLKPCSVSVEPKLQ